MGWFGVPIRMLMPPIAPKAVNPSSSVTSSPRNTGKSAAKRRLLQKRPDGEALMGGRRFEFDHGFAGDRDEWPVPPVVPGP